MKMRFTAVSFLVVGVSVAPAIGALGQERQPTPVVSFLDNSPKGVSVEQGKQVSFSIGVLNLSDVTRTVLVKAAPPTSSSVPSQDSVTVSVSLQTPEIVGRGDADATVEVRASDDAPVGSYTSQLVVYPGDGPKRFQGEIDRVPLTIAVTSSAPSLPNFASSVTQITLPKTLQSCFHGMLFCPSSVRFDSEALGRQFSTRDVVGWMVGGDGQQVPLIGSPEGLQVNGLEKPGVYTGKIDLTPGVDGGEVTITANVKDSLLVPFLILAAALGLAVLIDRFMRRIPADRLQRAHEALIQRVNSAARSIKIRRQPPFEQEVVPTPKDFIEKTAGSNERELEDSDTDEKRVKWEYGGEAYLALEQVVETYESLTERWARLLRAHARPPGSAHRCRGCARGRSG